MDWLTYALSGTALFGLVALSDKFMLTRYFADSLAYAWVASVAGALLGGIVLVVTGGGGLRLSMEGYVVAFLPGLLLFGATVTYMKAMSIGDPSVVMAFSQLAPIFAFCLGYLVLGESLTTLQLGGMVILVASAVALAFVSDYAARRTGGLQLRKRASATLSVVLPIMLLSSLLRATSDLAMKSVIATSDTTNIYWLSRLGILAGGMILLAFPASRQRVLSGARTLPLAGYAWVLLIEAGALISLYLMALALQTGPLALVTTISSNTAIFTLVYGAFASMIWRANGLGTSHPTVILIRLMIFASMGVGTLLVALPR